MGLSFLGAGFLLMSVPIAPQDPVVFNGLITPWVLIANRADGHDGGDVPRELS